MRGSDSREGRSSVDEHLRYTLDRADTITDAKGSCSIYSGHGGLNCVGWFSSGCRGEMKLKLLYWLGALEGDRSPLSEYSSGSGLSTGDCPLATGHWRLSTGDWPDGNITELTVCFSNLECLCQNK
jgi:hypothetical protein